MIVVKQRLQGIIIGLVIGCTLTAGCIVFAKSFEAITAQFPILVNGKEWTTDKPIVTIDGSTYLPLRALGEALNVKVEWNSELNRVEIGDAPIQSSNYSRQNPAPINTVQQIDIDTFNKKHSVALRVIETIRGDEAWKMIQKENQFNDKPDDGHEYIIAKIAVSALTVENDTAISISNYDFDCFTNNNEKYARKSVVTPSPSLSTQLYTGGNAEGYVVFHVKIGDNPKIVYGQNYDGSGGIWFSLQ